MQLIAYKKILVFKLDILLTGNQIVFNRKII